MSKTIWHSGPPPSVGWWPASLSKNSSSLRFWNGEFWSISAIKGIRPGSAGRLAAIRAEYQSKIQWTARKEQDMNHEFILNGKAYAIQTIVGDGLADVRLTENQPLEDAGLEPAGE